MSRYLVTFHGFEISAKPYTPQSLERPLPGTKNGGILTMQVVYETCLTRIEKKSGGQVRLQ